MTKSKNGTSEKWNLMKRYKKHLQKEVRTGEIFDELEVGGFLRERFQKCKRQISH